MDVLKLSLVSVTTVNQMCEFNLCCGIRGCMFFRKLFKASQDLRLQKSVLIY